MFSFLRSQLWNDQPTCSPVQCTESFCPHLCSVAEQQSFVPHLATQFAVAGVFDVALRPGGAAFSDHVELFQNGVESLLVSWQPNPDCSQG